MLAEPDRWFPAVELVDRYAHLIPAEDIQRRVEQRKRHGSSSTAHSAATTIIGGVLYTAIRQGHFERRLTADGELEVRASRTLGDTWMARRSRRLAEAGLMTLAEAGAVIGVGYDQVRSYVRQGLLQAVKRENVWVVPAEDVSGFERPVGGSRLTALLAEAGMMTPAEAAAVIGVTPSQVCVYVRNGLLPATKFENRLGVPAEDVRSFERPLRFGDPRLKTLLAEAGLMTAAEAGAVIGVTRQSVPIYVQRDLLPGTKLANGLWVVPARYVYGFKRPRSARPLVQQRAWDCILEGRPDPDNPHLYAYRGTVSRWSGDSCAVAALMERQDVVVGGAHAAAAHGAQLDPLADAACVYVAEVSMNGGTSDQNPMQGLVADPLGEVVVRAVAADSWQRLRRRVKAQGGVLNAPAAASAVDMLLSPQHRERQAAEEFLGA